VVSSAPILSLKHIDLDAKVDRVNKVHLNWHAANSNDIKGFEIQRSNDNETWKKIGWIPAHTNQPDFNYTDEETLSGNTWYRVKLVQQDHSWQFSPVKQVFLVAPHEEVRISPNPVNDYALLHLDANCNGTATVTIRTLFGRVMNVNYMILRPGDNQLMIDMSGIKQGIYLLEIKTEGKLFTKKIIKR
jgi:hypothetical protein